MPPTADLVLVGATILTMDPDDPQVQALAIRDGRIVARGRAADVLVHAGADTAVLEIGDGVAVPGFVDAHTHPVDAGVHLGRVDLSEAGTRGEALDRVAEAAEAAEPGTWVVAFGWDESAWPSGDPLVRVGLDEAAPANPVLAERVDRHVGVANSAALQRLDLDPAGHPGGRLVEEALLEALEAVAPDREGRVEALARFAAHAHAHGVTTVHGMVPAEDLRALEAAREGDRLGLRVRAYLLAEDLEALPAARPRPDPWLRLQGVKAFADGSLGARTAALVEPYADAPDERGSLLSDADELEAVLREARNRGLQTAVHAIGDRAVAAVLDGLEAAEVPPDAAPRVEHAELLPGDGPERFRDRGVVASCQPNFVGDWGHPGGLYEERLGEERTSTMNRFRDLLEAGVPLAFGSDHMPFGPLQGIAAAVEAPHEAQRLDAGEALRAYTRGAAAAAGDAPDLGVLAPGSWADVAVLSRDPRDDVRSVSVDLTVVAGQVVHDAR